MKKFLNSIEDRLSGAYSRIIENTKVPTEQLAIYRIFVGIFFLMMHRPYSWLIDIPPGLFRPDVLSIANLFESLPDALYFRVTDYLIIFLLCLIILGIKARLSFLMLFIVTIANMAFVYSFGKIDHGIFSALIFLLFYFTNSGTKLAMVPDGKKTRQGWALAIFSICLVFGFFTAGFEKAFNWVDFDLSTNGVLSWLYKGYFNINRDLLFAEYIFYLPNWLLEIMDYSAVVFELSGILFLYYSRKSWHLYLILAAFFHLANTLILNIPFTLHVAVYGIWLLSPALYKHKWMFLILLLPFIMDGVYLGLFLWIFTLCIASYSWNLQKYREQEFPRKEVLSK